LDLEFAASELIGEIDDFELARIDVENSTNKDILELKHAILAALKENTLILNVELNGGKCTSSIVLSFRK
jgi:hypothetical protein